MKRPQIQTEAEKAIVNKVLENALAFGYSFSLAESGEFLVERTKNQKEVTDVLFDMDEGFVNFYEGERYLGAVYFVFGNDGFDVISDYNTSKEVTALVKAVADLENHYEKLIFG